MSLIVQFVVGQFQFVEADHLPHPGLSGGRRIWVNVDSGRHWGVCVTCYHPLRAVVHVSAQFTFFYDINPRLSW